MGLLDDVTHKEYYRGNELGNYQFTSLDDIINQFMVVYVGENKIIPKASRIDIAFHAQRALQELSFDTFKSIKSHQIDLPPTLVMPLPHDYVNYTKLSWVDSSGIKHPLYHTSDTNNPFQIAQKEDGSYNFDYTSVNSTGILQNSDFSEDLVDTWEIITPQTNLSNKFLGAMAIDDGKLKTSFVTRNGLQAYNWSAVHTAYQAIDVSDTEYLDISALGTADLVTITDQAGGSEPAQTSPGILRFGLSTQIPEDNYINNEGSNPNHQQYQSSNIETSLFDLVNIDGDASYLEWVATASGTTTGTKEMLLVDVTQHSTVYAIVVSYVDFSSLPSTAAYKSYGKERFLANSIDDLLVTKAEASNYLIPKEGNEKNSSTWNNYKSTTPSENNNDDYEDNVYWQMGGKRYGLDPQYAQINGSFYIDNRLGRINFSSNISGKTVILDYISDSLGTDSEMQVHKFAEEAMYKCIAYAFLASTMYGQQLVPRLKKEKFAAVRQAKLRLSNIKLEELTQILRGKSKQIKH